MSALCTWCGTEFEPRSNGGSAQRFCSTPCRRDFDSACRIWAATEYEVERVSIFTLRAAFYKRARCVESDPALEGAKALETEARTDGTLSGAAPVMDEQRPPPDMTDMFLAGLPLREAVAIRHAIEQEPDKPAEHWWNLVSGSAHSVQGTC